MQAPPLLLLSMCVLFAGAGPSSGQSPSQTVQRLFDAMSAHDANAARQLFTPDAMLFSVHPSGAPVAIPYEKWVAQLGASKDAWLERTWNPTLLEHGPIAVFWAE